MHVPVIVVIISATILRCHTLVIKSSRVLFCFQMNLMGKQFWTKTVISTPRPENNLHSSSIVAFSGRACYFGYYLSWCETSSFWLKIFGPYRAADFFEGVSKTFWPQVTPKGKPGNAFLSIFCDSFLLFVFLWSRMADRLATMFGLSNQGLTESAMKSIGSKLFMVLTQ